VFTELAKGAADCAALQQRLGLHERSARDFLDGLVALGALQRKGTRYSNTPESGAFLDRAKPSYIGGILEMAAARVYPFWASLTDALKTGQPQNESKAGDDFFGKLYADPARLRGFLSAMTGVSMGPAQALARKFPWKKYRTFLDVGGAQGCVSVQVALAAQAVPISVESFLSGNRLTGASMSPDGHYLALLWIKDDLSIVSVLDRTGSTAVKPVMIENTRQHFRPRWCAWANKTRLLCSVYGQDVIEGQFFPVTRLVGVNADGTNLTVLMNGRLNDAGQLQDRVVDWTPNDPDGVLIELDDDHDGYPAVYRMDVNNGDTRQVVAAHAPVRSFDSDHNGNVRLGWGVEKTKVSFYGRLNGERQWKQLARAEAFATADILEPVAIVPGTNFAYATRDKDGRRALWKMDLENEHDPELVYENADVDVGSPLFASDGRLIGIHVDTERPGIYYTDQRLRGLTKAIDKALPGRSNQIVDMTDDESALLIHSESDVVPGEYYVFELQGAKAILSLLGSSVPGLAGAVLSTTKPIEYAATDNTWVPGYLTLPAQPGSGKPPLVVMPHGGPYARDVWAFDAWVQLLASRGYAVLQMNFRGSTGYGSAWFKGGFQDWGGLPYGDVIDATQWAIERGYADPKRVCVVGASFGGYIALAAATRDSMLFRCAVSIAGVSDLQELQRDNHAFQQWQIVNLSVGTDQRRLKQYSPLRSASQMDIPLLMIHGKHDYTVDVEQTKRMAAELKRNDKDFKVVYVDGADHYFGEDSQMRVLLTEMAAFLESHL
jgi:dipeptidyl aminopeptidase/acylaminoacyl peptidase